MKIQKKEDKNVEEKENEDVEEEEGIEKEDNVKEDMEDVLHPSLDTPQKKNQKTHLGDPKI